MSLPPRCKICGKVMDDYLELKEIIGFKPTHPWFFTCSCGYKRNFDGDVDNVK